MGTTNRAGDQAPKPMPGTTPSANSTAARQQQNELPRFKRQRPITDRLIDLLPEWLAVLVRSRQRQLLYVERQMQRKLYREYRAQLREFEPLLRTRGRMIGEVLVEAMMPGRHGGPSDRRISYADVVARSLQDTIADKLPVREVVDTLDPLVTPVITPFVDGLKQPIYEKVDEMKDTVLTSFVVTAAGCTVLGFVVGRYGPGSRGRGKGG